jgi:peroxiredoxin
MKRDRKSPNVLSLVLTGVVVLVAAAGGVYLGGAFGASNQTRAPVESDVFTDLKLTVGSPFPDVQLTDRNYDSRQTADLLNPSGTVVLFLDDGCQPCEDMVANWTSMVTSGAITADRIVGITFDAANKIDVIEKKYGLPFPVYADESFTFLSNYGVDGFPLTIVVDGNGTVRRVESDYRVRIGANELAAAWGR